MSGEHHYLVSNLSNLPASAGICNHLFLRLLGQTTLHFYADIIAWECFDVGRVLVWVPTLPVTVQNNPTTQG